MDQKTSLFAYFIDATPIPMLSRRPQYPATLCKLEYLDEGGANIVYRIVVVNEGPSPARLDEKVLRLRKNVKHSRPAQEQLQAYNDNFNGLFDKEHLLEHSLVALDDGLVPALNELLKKRHRPAHRAQDFLYQDEQHGMLLTDMTPGAGENSFQLKPKWLLQSPDAPQDATRCRTCALRAQRLARGNATATDVQRICPLMLASASQQARLVNARKLCKDESIANFLATDAQQLFSRLKDCQEHFDQRGMLNIRTVDEIMSLCRAMTLRDCTLYIRHTGHGNFDARLGDLDLKQPEKLMAWRKVERTLIEEGWYTNTEDGDVFKREDLCLLSRWITP